LKNRVRELREKLGLTQKELGQRVNVSRQAVNAIETNKYDPSIWLAHDLARLFELPIEDVFLFAQEDRK
jgi:putative transcriptional regulator